jgi:AbrB family looped-hinge helix DNA binding protein
MSKPIIDVVKLGKRGEIVLPRRVRSALALQEGDELMLAVDERRVTLERRGRGFKTYLDALNPTEEPPRRATQEPPRRGLARFLPGRK